MKNTLKKVMASVIAVTSLAIGMTGISANAAVVNSYHWTTRHVVGAPGGASTSDTCDLTYSTYGAKVKCTSASHTNVNANGWIWVACPNSNAYMASVKLYYGSPKVCNPSVSGIIPSVKYTFSAYSNTSPDTFNTSGDIAARSSSNDYYT